MAQHFLLSAAAKTLSLASVFQMKDDVAEMTFRHIRWAETDGARSARIAAVWTLTIAAA
jgi:predicted AAA+ superfamily ATPase